MPYVSIRTFPQSEEDRRRAAERVQQLLMELWGCEADWISVSVENVDPADWEDRIIRGEMEEDAAHMLIRDGEKLYE